MDKLFAKRLEQHLKQRYRYIRYIANDHSLFLLLLGIILLAYGYHQWLLSMTVWPLWLFAVVVSAVFSVVLSTVKVATLLKSNDYFYLMNTSLLTRTYFFSAIGYSLIYGILTLITTLLIVSPLFNQQHQNLTFLFGFVGLLVTFVSLLAQVIYGRRIQNYIVSFLLYVISFYYPWISVGLLVGIVIFLAIQTNRPLPVMRLIALENRRIYQQLSFINWFIDVPNIGNDVKVYPFEKLFKQTTNAIEMFVVRLLLRRKNHVEMIFSQLVIGCILLLVFKQWYIQGSILILVVLLTVMQLFGPLVIVFKQPYSKQLPFDTTIYRDAIKTQLIKLACVEMCILCIASVFTFNVVNSIVLIMISMLMYFFVLPLYLQRKIDKM